jgi:hypothetical protein
MSQRLVVLAGYEGRRLPSLVAAVEALDATLLDIRFSPYSRNPAWNRKALTEALGDRYRWVKPWGNVLYQGGPTDCQIADFTAGLAVWDALTGPTILLCRERRSAECHRMTVATMLAEVRDIRIVDLDEALAEVTGPAVSQLALFGEAHDRA